MNSIPKKFLITILFLSLFDPISTAIDEGNILLSMTSNFELQHSKKLINNKNYYTIELSVGTPARKFNVQVDTSTSTSWLPSENCKDCVNAKNKYNHESSKTSSPTNKEIELEDEDGNVKGIELSDNIQLGKYKLKQFGFVEVTDLEEDFKDHNEGKLGLGFKSNINNDDFNFMERLKKRNLIKRKIFSINEINNKKGMLFVGDLPGKQYYSFCNVTTDTTELDNMYKESWICELTHFGVFNINKGIFNKLKYYEEIKNTKLVNFDSAYDYIAVPISEKENIELVLEKANLKCVTEEKKEKSSVKKEDPLKNKIHDEEISIICETTPKDLSNKSIALTFLLQGFAYSIPLDSLFSQRDSGKMEMLIKNIDDEKAIWTFGYPFMNQFLMVFNYEDENVGIKKLKKTALPIISVKKEWDNWYLDQQSGVVSSGKTWLIILAVILVIVVAFCVVRAIKRRSLNSNGPAFNTGYDPNKVY